MQSPIGLIKDALLQLILSFLLFFSLLFFTYSNFKCISLCLTMKYIKVTYLFPRLTDVLSCKWQLKTILVTMKVNYR